MTRPGALVLCALMVFGAACGNDEPPAGEAPDSQEESTKRTEASARGAGLEVRLTVDPDPPLAGQTVLWRLRVENIGDEELGLVFPTGQQGDVTLLEGEKEAWRWSEGQAFIQAVIERPLPAGEVMTIDLEGVLDVDPGAYEVTALVTADRAPPPVSTTVVVEAA